MEPLPFRKDVDLSAEFRAPESDIPAMDRPSSPLAPRNAHLRARGGYVAEPVEEAAPPPVMEPRVTFLEQRSVELGEVQYPLDEVELSSKMMPVRNVPAFLGAEMLKRNTERIRAREGSRAVRQLRFWSLWAAVFLLGTVISSILTGGLFAGKAMVLNAPLPVLFFGLLMWSIGCLQFRVRSYGFVPWLRVIRLYTSGNADVKEWRKGYGAAERMELRRQVGR